MDENQKLCPYGIAYGTEHASQVYCRNDDLGLQHVCAWWNSEHKECCKVVETRALETIAKALETIANWHFDNKGNRRG